MPKTTTLRPCVTNRPRYAKINQPANTIKAKHIAYKKGLDCHPEYSGSRWSTGMFGKTINRKPTKSRNAKRGTPIATCRKEISASFTPRHLRSSVNVCGILVRLLDWAFASKLLRLHAGKF
jgi:hypothetical protein